LYGWSWGFHHIWSVLCHLTIHRQLMALRLLCLMLISESSVIHWMWASPFGSFWCFLQVTNRVIYCIKQCVLYHVWWVTVKSCYIDMSIQHFTDDLMSCICIWTNRILLTVLFPLVGCLWLDTLCDPTSSVGASKRTQSTDPTHWTHPFLIHCFRTFGGRAIAPFMCLSKPVFNRSHTLNNGRYCEISHYWSPFIFRPHHSTTYINAVCCYQPSSVVCQSVGLSDSQSVGLSVSLSH